jgi:hypothetical protein
MFSAQMLMLKDGGATSFPLTIRLEASSSICLTGMMRVFFTLIVSP